MQIKDSYLNATTQTSIAAIVSAIDKDVEHGEDILMLGYSLVLMAPIFAPIAPPQVLLPLMALVFVISVCRARANFLAIRDKLLKAIDTDKCRDWSRLNPIVQVFSEHPKQTLSQGFNPLKNRMRTARSVLGALMINPLWMPIFYTLGLQFSEEQQLSQLNKAVIAVEQRWGNH